MTDRPAATPTTGAVPLASAQGRWIVSAAVLGSAMAMLDGTVVNVALPHIADDFDVGLSALQWTVTAYLLTLSSLILVGGSLGDRLGRRRVFVIGIVWFAVASVVCGIAPNATVLIVARAVQGIGGALLTPGSLAMLQSSLAHDDRPRAIGLWSGLGGVAAAGGPFLGGWLADGPGWRWAFFINAPIAVVCAVLAVRHVPESRDPLAERSFDLAGAATGALALAGITFALIQAADGGSASVILVITVAALVAAAGFVVVERRVRAPMIPPHLFASRTFSVVNVMTFVVYAALGGFLFVGGVQLQVVSGYSAFWAGAALTPATILMLLFSARSGAFAARVGPRWPLTAGAALLGVGLLLMLRIGPHAYYPSDVLPGAMVMGVGLVLMVAPLTATVLAAVEDEHAGIASGVNNAVARAAGLIAVAAVPLISGTAADAGLGASFDDTFRRSVIVFAALAFVSAVVAAAGLRTGHVRIRPTRPSRLPGSRTARR